MNLYELSLKRPVFISCIVIVLFVLGIMSFQKLGIDLFPEVNFPIVAVITTYPGSGPEEVESLVSKPIEEAVSSINGIQKISSNSHEGTSMVILEFSLETDIKYAEQQVRDKISASIRDLPKDILSPVIRRVDPSENTILRLGLHSDKLNAIELYTLADQVIKPKLEQVANVAQVDIWGGKKREIHINVDYDAVIQRELSLQNIANKLSTTNQNIPAGKITQGSKDVVIRSLGEFTSVKQMNDASVSFFGDERPTRVSDIARVDDSHEDIRSMAKLDGSEAVFLDIYRQSGTNTVQVADGVTKSIEALNGSLKDAKLDLVWDGAKRIRANVTDVYGSIALGTLLAVLVVFFFLGNLRSTFITGLALPNSLIGTFILIFMAGFTINVMSLLALSLAVGLLIDDAIVVRENIFRHMELGKTPREAALFGTQEVALAVVATTFTVIAVFLPVGFLQGVVGRFFKQFGLTVCFAMLLSMFDAFTMAPMLSAFLGKQKGENGKFLKSLLEPFDKFWTYTQKNYSSFLQWTLAHRLKVLASALGIFILSLIIGKFIPSTFLPNQDDGELSIHAEAPPGTTIETMESKVKDIEATILSHKEVLHVSTVIGESDGSSNMARCLVILVPFRKRKSSTSDFKKMIRTELKSKTDLMIKVGDLQIVGGGAGQPFGLSFTGHDLDKLIDTTDKLLPRFRQIPGLIDVDVSYRRGKPELQLQFDETQKGNLGISEGLAGQEIRAMVDGVIVSKYKEHGNEYDIRLRLDEKHRDISKYFDQIRVPNMNNKLIYLHYFSKLVPTEGPTKIYRENRSRAIQINANLEPKAPMGRILKDVKKLLSEPGILPPDITYSFSGQAVRYKELVASIAKAMFLAVLFVYFILASLYESFIIPLTIMLALPLAIVGAFWALLITGEQLNIYSMIGLIMLLGLVTKNSILLVDYTMQLIRSGKSRNEALLHAGSIRLRPIMMTSFALIAGMIPIALGLSEASKSRSAMGVGLIGGLITSTLLTLVVVPAAFTYIDDFEKWLKKKLIVRQE